MMSAYNNEVERPEAAAMAIWGSEGGALRRLGAMDHQFGRRIEADRSWTVYHVFTGAPHQGDGSSMIGLTRLDAEHCVPSLNVDIEHRKKTTSVTPRARTGSEGAEG